MKARVVWPVVILVVGALGLFPPFGARVLAAEAEKAPAQSWPQDGPFGTYDRGALQRGFQVYKEVCSACHAMKRVRYRNLADLGYTPEQIKAVAGQYSVMDGPNDEGEMFERAARPSDPFKSPFANDQAAKAGNGGAFPPDLSLIVKARSGGPDYVYSLLTGFGSVPVGQEIPEGKYWNRYFPGHVISMAPPLADGQVVYADGSPQTVSQYARDVAQFLSWGAEPELEQRKRTGVKVLLFLAVFSAVFYAAKRKVWSDLH